MSATCDIQVYRRVVEIDARRVTVIIAPRVSAVSRAIFGGNEGSNESSSMTRSADASKSFNRGLYVKMRHLYYIIYDQYVRAPTGKFSTAISTVNNNKNERSIRMGNSNDIIESGRAICLPQLSACVNV